MDHASHSSSLRSADLIAIVLLWPPAVLHIQHSPGSTTVRGSMSDVRAAIFVIAVAAFIAAIVFVIISAVWHQA